MSAVILCCCRKARSVYAAERKTHPQPTQPYNGEHNAFRRYHRFTLAAGPLDKAARLIAATRRLDISAFDKTFLSHSLQKRLAASECPTAAGYLELLKKKPPGNGCPLPLAQYRVQRVLPGSPELRLTRSSAAAPAHRGKEADHTLGNSGLVGRMRRRAGNLFHRPPADGSGSKPRSNGSLPDFRHGHLRKRTGQGPNLSLLSRGDPEGALSLYRSLVPERRPQLPSRERDQSPCKLLLPRPTR